MTNGIKLISRDEVKVISEQLKKEGKTIGFTSGVFDLLHRGHAEYLAEAKKLCDMLIVGVNSDSSVKLNKGPGRPLNREVDRAYLVSQLDSVDYVFVFAETNNNQNIELIQPSLYIKAGDYDRSKLTSAPRVEKYGGRVEIIPSAKGFSTSSLIEQIRTQTIPTQISYEPRPALFVDRDGTIIEEVDYISNPREVKLVPGAGEGLKEFQDKGYRIILVTNQPGIGMGYYSQGDFFVVNREMFRALTPFKVEVQKVYFCPHSQADKCACRKPNTFMLEQAVNELNIIKEKSVVIGDMTSDIQLGKTFGCKTILVRSGKGGKDSKYKVEADIVADSILEGAGLLFGKK